MDTLNVSRDLITSGAEVNIQKNNGWTALMEAAKNGHIDCLRELITSGAEVNIQKNNGLDSFNVCRSEWTH